MCIFGQCAHLFGRALLQTIPEEVTAVARPADEFNGPLGGREGHRDEEREEGRERFAPGKKTEKLARLLLGYRCASGWHYYSGTRSCFYTSTDAVNQSLASEDCYLKDLHPAELASVSDQAEMDFIISITSVI